MTSYWGPLGWATLHSASLLYSDSPSYEEQLLMTRFLDCFKNTISCYHCKSHFIDMLSKYSKIHPDFLSSKKKFMLFVFRAHNTVNKRLEKPILQSFKICLQTLKSMESYSSLQALRQAYMNYLQTNWNRENTYDGLEARKKCSELFKINTDYFNIRTIDWDIDSNESVLEFIENVEPKYQIFSRNSKSGGFKNGKLVFRK